METQEIVTNLYALRAGLSLISQEKDKMDAEIDAALTAKNNAVKRARSTADNSKEAIEQQIKKNSNLLSMPIKNNHGHLTAYDGRRNNSITTKNF